MIRYSVCFGGGIKTTVAQLIDTLKLCDPNAIVRTWDPDSDEWECISGITYSDSEVKCHTDE